MIESPEEAKPLAFANGKHPALPEVADYQCPGSKAPVEKILKDLDLYQHKNLACLLA